MTTWTFDEPAFVAEVLKPVQDGWPPERDHFRVYQLPLDTDDRVMMDIALEGVRRKLNSPRFRAYRRACDLLRSQHDDAAAVLRDSGKRQAHRQEVRAELTKLKAGLEHRLGGAPGLPPTEVADLVRESHGAHTRPAILAALAELNVRELEPVTLPPAAAPTQWPELRARLVMLRFGSLWDYLSSVLSGPATTAGQVADRRARLRVSRDESAAAEMTVLKLVEQWLSGGLAEVLRHELLSTLESELAYGYEELDRAVRKVADRLAAVGLPADPAAVTYALWCAGRTSSGQKLSWQDTYQAAVRDRQLRTARDVLMAQPALSAEWQQQRDELSARLDTLDADLDRAKDLERTDVEAAVELYHRIGAQLDDPAIDIALERCRPAPPPGVRATVIGQRVVVTWGASPATAGRIRYRVVRDDQELAVEVNGLEHVDEHPVGGIPLTYAVFATRDGVQSAEAAVSAPITVLRDVEQTELKSGPDSITGHWRLPPTASGVSVTRIKDGVSQTLQGVTSTGFVDRQVDAGVTYTYRVRAEYLRPNGSVAQADGVVVSAACQELPVAVTDLRVDVDEDEFILRWTPPAHGEVRILEGSEGAVPDTGVVPARTALRHGTPLQTTGIGNSGHVRATPSSERRKYLLIPITVVGELAAVGITCKIDTRQSPITSLRADRFGPTVRLTWHWPPGVAEARVVWRERQPPTGPEDTDASAIDVTRAAYDSRGVHLTVPAGDYWFGVCVNVVEDGQPLRGPLALVRESSVAQVRYSVRRVRSRFKRMWELVVDSASPPPVVLVAKAGTRPMSANDGEPVVRLETGTQPARVGFTIPAMLRRPVYLRAFSLDDHVVLVPARVEQLTVS